MFTLKTHVRDRGRVTANPYILLQEGTVKVYLQAGKFYWGDGKEIKPEDLPGFARQAYHRLPIERKMAVGFVKQKRKPQPKADPDDYVETVKVPEAS